MAIQEIESIYDIAQNMQESVSISSYDNTHQEALRQVKEVSELLGVPYETVKGQKYEWYTVSKGYFQVTFWFQD